MLLFDNSGIRHTFAIVLDIVVDNEGGFVNVQVSSGFYSLMIFVVLVCQFFVLGEKSFFEFFIGLRIVFFKTSCV